MIILDMPLKWQDIAHIAAGAPLALSPAAGARLTRAHAIKQAVVVQGLRAYGVNTGVGALSDTVVPLDQQAALSRNILMSHAVGIGPVLAVAETRAIMAAAVNNFAHGYSGLRPVLVEHLVAMLNAGCTPEVRAQGSVGYLSHMAAVGLVLIGAGAAQLKGERLAGAQALDRLGLPPLVLEAKEGLSLVNGTVCATGLACLALAGAENSLDWADAIAAMLFELQGCQRGAIDPDAMRLRASPGLLRVTESLNRYLKGSTLLAAAAGAKTQDALSLRAIPQVHGAIRDVVTAVGGVVDRELASVTDNPVIAGSPEAPVVRSQAHAIGAAVGLAIDQLCVALGQLAIMSERRVDRLVNPLVSSLPAFLATGNGANSGFMIGQYAALSLVGEIRRLAAPASLDAGITSGLQEDFLAHATPASLKALQILRNLEHILAIEWLAAGQAYDLRGASPAPALAPIWQFLRGCIATYRDDRPLGADIALAADLLRHNSPLI